MKTENHVASLSGKTIRWIFNDGPVAGTTFEHTFHEDGTVTWRGVDGPAPGAGPSPVRTVTSSKVPSPRFR